MAARCHWRFIVRDQYGYVIQNARVYAYQPGTTTNFLGSAYDAASGGSSVTNPMTSNSEGEVQAFFDTPQSIDIFVDDNSDTAYRAIDGPGTVRSFSAFTETGSVYPKPEDVQLDDAVPFAHGASEHTNITRTVWIPVADSASLDGATLASLGSTPNIVRTKSAAATTTDGETFSHVFQDWASGAISVQIYWAGDTTNANPVRWSLVAKSVAAAGDVTAAGTTVNFTSGQASVTANQLVKDTLTSTTVTPAANGDLFMLTARRLGDDGADTYTGVAHIIGVILSYTATQ